MQNFIVLGLVPGTNIQLNFTFWLSVTLSLLGVCVLSMLIRRRQIVYTWILCLRINRVLRHTAPYQV